MLSGSTRGLSVMFNSENNSEQMRRTVEIVAGVAGAGTGLMAVVFLDIYGEFSKIPHMDQLDSAAHFFAVLGLCVPAMLAGVTLGVVTKRAFSACGDRFFSTAEDRGCRTVASNDFGLEEQRQKSESPSRLTS